MFTINQVRSRLIIAAVSLQMLVAIACSGGAEQTEAPPTATPISTPTATAVPSTASVTNTPTTTSPTATSVAAPTATSTATATATPAATTTPQSQSTAPPQPTATPTPPAAVTPGVPNTVELIASMDNTLYESSIGATSNGAGQGLFAGRTNNDSLRRALIAFPIGDTIPAGSVIHSVDLILTVTRTATDAQNFTLHRVTSRWGEGTSDATGNEGGGAGAAAGDATWTHASSPDQSWETPGGDFVQASSSEVVTTGQGPYTWGSSDAMIADVQAWADAPETNFGWILIGDENETKSANRFASRENSEASSRPRLIVNFTPPS